MTARACPTCGQPIDALRAPALRVVGGKVIAYCSAECKSGSEHTPLPEPLAEADDDAPSEVRAEGDITPLPLAAATVSSPPVLAPAAPVRRHGMRLVVVAAIAVAVIAAGVVYASQSWRDEAPRPEAPRPASAMPAPAPRPVAPPPQPRVPDRAQILADARQTLTAALADPSPRVRRLAALALSRTGAKEALAELESALASDTSEIRRLEVAYALARAGAASGTDVLVGALASKRRDVRLEAARALASMGDARAVPRLHEALDATQLRLGAAESLARLGNAEGIAILKEALEGNVEETRMRAAVALGRAGDASGQELLRQVATDAKLEIGADAALARLGDREALPALTRAMALSALRVQAAVGLRRLGVQPDLAVLADALAASDEVAKISAAEAVLVLLSPEPPAELR